MLVVNAGSSSLKLRVLGDADEVLGSHDLPLDHGEVDAAAVATAVGELPTADAVGHRIVHGGARFTEAVRIDDEVRAALGDLTELAPLHQPKSLAALDAVADALPELPAVGCFDTTFHSTLPEAAATYALPTAWRERYGLRRYGFHGLSHAYATRRARQLLERDDLRLVTCHLGAGASLAAVRHGRSVDTTMGFTPLEGLVMATRSGSVDPGLLLWLLERQAVDERELAKALERESGMLALADTTDMREVVSGASRGEPRATLAFEVYIHRLVSLVGAMAVSAGGLDALVFTGGVGENSPAVRAAAVERLAFFDAALDIKRNEIVTGDAAIKADGSGVEILVVEAREDLEIAVGVRRVLAPSA